MDVTFSKQWIHFLRSDRCPPTSTILQDTAGPGSHEVPKALHLRSPDGTAQAAGPPSERDRREPSARSAVTGARAGRELRTLDWPASDPSPRLDAPSPRRSTCSPRGRLGDGPASATARGRGQPHRVCPPTGCEAGRWGAGAGRGQHRARPSHGASSPPCVPQRCGDEGRRDGRRPLSSSPPTRPGEGPGSPQLGPICTAVRRRGAGQAPRGFTEETPASAGGLRPCTGRRVAMGPRGSCGRPGNCGPWRWGPRPGWRVGLRGAAAPEPGRPGARSQHEGLGDQVRCTRQGHPSVTAAVIGATP